MRVTRGDVDAREADVAALEADVEALMGDVDASAAHERATASHEDAFARHEDAFASHEDGDAEDVLAVGRLVQALVAAITVHGPRPFRQDAFRLESSERHPRRRRPRGGQELSLQP